LGFYDLARVFKVSGHCGTVLTALIWCSVFADNICTFTSCC